MRFGGDEIVQRSSRVRHETVQRERPLTSKTEKRKTQRNNVSLNGGVSHAGKECFTSRASATGVARHGEDRLRGWTRSIERGEGGRNWRVMSLDEEVKERTPNSTYSSKLSAWQRSTRYRSPSVKCQRRPGPRNSYLLQGE